MPWTRFVAILLSHRLPRSLFVSGIQAKIFCSFLVSTSVLLSPSSHPLYLFTWSEEKIYVARDSETFCITLYFFSPALQHPQCVTVRNWEADFDIRVLPKQGNYFPRCSQSYLHEDSCPLVRDSMSLGLEFPTFRRHHKLCVPKTQTGIN